MNSYCQIQAGVFIPRSCGQQGTLQCEQCQRPICLRHQAIAELPRILCVECAPAAEANDESTWENDHTTSFRYRQRYHDQGYVPMIWYAGHSHSDAGGSGSTDGAAVFDLPADDDALDDDNAEFDDDGDVTAFDS